MITKNRVVITPDDDAYYLLNTDDALNTATDLSTVYDGPIFIATVTHIIERPTVVRPLELEDTIDL